MEPVVIPLQPRGFGSTMRRDAWWAQPLVTFLVLGAFVVYATWAAFQGNHYEYGPYLSPFYSPDLFGDCPHSWFGPWSPAWWPAVLPFSAALLILWAPGGFRFTCYYYRGAYYKAFWADPPSCTVGEPRKTLPGENSFPLIFQNVHRYFLYLALVFLIVLWLRRLEGAVVHRSGDWRACHSGSASARWCWPPTSSPRPATPSAATRCGTWSAAGSIEFSDHPAPDEAATTACAASTATTCCWAWMSLFGVAFADLYVRLCSMGILTDWRIL